MKRLIFSCSLAVHFTILAQRPSVDDWPVLKHYDQAHLAKIVLPVGGMEQARSISAASGICGNGKL